MRQIILDLTWAVLLLLALFWALGGYRSGVGCVGVGNAMTLGCGG